MTSLIPFVVIAIAIAILIAFSIQGKTKYYKKVFNDEHYTEIVQWLHSVLRLGSVAEPRPENNTALFSSAECTFTFTRDIDDLDVIHIAISQQRAPTTHSACERLAFIIIQTLNQNKANTDFYYTETNIHHLIFAKELSGEWLANDAAMVLSQPYERPQFHFQSIRDSP